MNLLKFKDQIKPGDDRFNTYCKGRYVYWVQMRYAVPFDFMSTEQYVACEQSPKLIHQILNNPKCYWDTDRGDIMPYVDPEETDALNNTTQYARLNQFVTDNDITIDEVKKFRTWLAESLLCLDQDSKGNQLNQYYTEDFTHVLEYYRNGMYDDVLKWLGQFGNIEIGITRTGAGCSNCNSNDLSGLYKESLSITDPQYVYRKNIHDAMTKQFTDVDFWVEKSDLFIAEFKQYIDNILTLNLQLGRSQYRESFADCPCVPDTLQESGRMILGNLSKSLEYILEGMVQGNRNFMRQSFNEWASQLYEVMEWS